MTSYVMGFNELGQAQVAAAGGKGAHLGELSRIEGVQVPPGFCVTTEAFRQVLSKVPSLDSRLDELSRLKAEDRDAIATLSAQVREAIEATALPEELAKAITAAVARLNDKAAYAVRSSATAEDLSAASFAGQQDTYLNVVGPEAILDHVRRCWASLFSERAVTYRQRNGFDHRKVQMAVVVQQMVFPKAAGILFTADPMTGNRKVASIEASFGLGEALVSGLVNADVFKVRNGEIVARTIASKQRAIEALPGGGTQQRTIDPAQQEQPALTAAQVLRLVELGRRIEAHFGGPQDIEWCLVGDDFHFVQSRPITTLFPVPDAGDAENHVYLSVGHQQMMTDAMKPLALSLYRLTTRATMYEAGGRLFADATRLLTNPATRTTFLEMARRSDPLIHGALQTLLERGDFIPTLPTQAPPRPAPAGGPPPPIATDPAIVSELMEQTRTSLATLRQEIQKNGPALLEFILADIKELQRVLFDPRSSQAVMAGMEAAWWLNEHFEAWLGEKNAADVLTQSVPDNVTSEMGLALLDVADAIRPHPEVVAFLERAEAEANEGFLDALPGLAGGQQAQDAIRGWLEKYGMRCVGEIDIARTRWIERPITLVPALLGNIRNFEPGAGAKRFEQGRKEAARKEQEVLAKLRALPDGAAKADETKQKIDRVRTFAGYREFPKYGVINRYFLYRQALLKEAERLVKAGVLRETEDLFFLTFPEVQEVVRTNQVDDALIRERKEAFRTHQSLIPPRVITSEGEAITASYRREGLPPDALVGLAVSAGTVEGRARVLLDIAKADLEPGDILVTAFTDPSWTPLFVAIKGLVTEIGGVMTHGAVIAREYGLPAVVGIERATQRIRDGQRIRVNGTEGYVELLA